MRYGKGGGTAELVEKLGYDVDRLNAYHTRAANTTADSKVDQGKAVRIIRGLRRGIKTWKGKKRTVPGEDRTHNLLINSQTR